jgi:H+/gluconate symporter-like permease
MSVFGVLGLIVSLLVLMVFVFRGFHVIPVSLIASLIAILANNANIWDVLSQNYAVSMQNFVGNYLIMFFLGTLVGEILSKSGAARQIAIKLAQVFGAKRAILIVVLASTILSYGGVSVFVIVFSIYPIALFLFKEADIPKRLIPGSIMLGAGSFTMTALPGTPALTNIIPTKYLGTTATAAPIMGTIAAIVMFSVGYAILIAYEKRVKAKGERFFPGPNDVVAELNEEEIKQLPSFLLSVIPIIVIIGVILSERIMKIGLPSVFTVIIALFAGSMVGYALFWNKIEQKKEALNTSGRGSVGALLNTAAVVGFGGTIRAVPAFQSFVQFATSLQFAPIISAALAVNVIAGITGSSSAGITIFMESMAQNFLDLGVQAEVLHRVTAIAAGVLDSLPHAGPNVTFLAVTGLTYREGYPAMFLMTCVVPLAGLITALILAAVGIV